MWCHLSHFEDFIQLRVTGKLARNNAVLPATLHKVWAAIMSSGWWEINLNYHWWDRVFALRVNCTKSETVKIQKTKKHRY